MDMMPNLLSIVPMAGGQATNEEQLFCAVIMQALDDLRNPQRAYAAWRWWLPRVNPQRRAVFLFAGLAGMEQQARKAALRIALAHWREMAKYEERRRRAGKPAASRARLLAMRQIAERVLSS